MSVIVVGVSHDTAPIEIRERLTYRPSDMPDVLAVIRSASGAPEAAMISTCNRTEAYIVEGSGDVASTVLDAMSERLGEDVRPFAFTLRDRDAVGHLIRVAAGLDSMIIGESQIQGQVRDSLEASREHSGAVLHRLFHIALAAASRIRNETGIGRGAASVSSAAVQLAKKIFGSLNGRRAMVLGAGDVAELSLECLIREGVKAAIVANRTFERAAILAESYGATALHYDECWDRMGEVDVLLCSTSSPHPVVTRDHLERTMRVRGGRPLCVIDIALPRDVDADVGELENVFLYDLDDLRAAAAANVERRHEDVPAANAIVVAEAEKYWQWLAGLQTVPVVTQFRSEMNRLREAELRDAMRRMGELSPAQTQALEHFSRSLMNKFLHEPSVRLKSAAANGRGLGVVDTARYLFGLEETE